MAWRLAWAATGALVVLAAAAWLRRPATPYLAACAAATVLAVALTAHAAWRGLGRMAWRAAFAVGITLFTLVAARAQRAVWRVDNDWPRFSARIADGAMRDLRRELEATTAALQSAARAALDAPADPVGAFRHLAPLPGGLAERGVVLYAGGRPLAWSGTVRVPTDTLTAPLGATLTPFYVALHAVATRGDRRAVATALVHAEPPADRLAAPLDRTIAARTRLAAFEFLPPTDERAPSGYAVAPAGTVLFVVRPEPPAREAVRLRELEHTRAQLAILLALVVLAYLATTWPRPAPLWLRLASLGVPLAALAVVPLNALSALTPLLDPSFYFAALGGPFTSSVGALGLTSALVLIGLLAVLRSRVRLPSRWLALLIVLGVAGVGPFLLRRLAEGISPPAYGVPVALWLAWQGAIFLAATSVLVAGASAGRVALGGRRGAPSWLAPLLASAAALLAPLVWQAPGAWPDWYAYLWILTIAALALARRSRGLMVAAAIVAGFGATTLVWGVSSRKRVELAQRDVEGLRAVDPDASALALRFAAELQGSERARSRAELLRRFVGSPLAVGDYPVQLTAWRADGTPEAELAISDVTAPRASLAPLIEAARREGQPVLDTVIGTPGMQLLLAVPHADGGTTTAAISPRTRLLPEDPFATLLGVAPETAAEPPYSLTPIELGSARAPAGDSARWTRAENEMHGNWTVPSASGLERVHVEVELRTLDALVQRGTLVVLLDMAIAALLWTLAVVSDGGFRRWLRVRQRGWSTSYRARLTIALFAFFVIPAAAFAAWSYRRLRTEDLQSRELLVRETLRAVASGDAANGLAGTSDRLDTPLLLFHDGELRGSSDTLYDALAPIGRFLRPEVYEGLALREEVTTRSSERVGGSEALFGYRAATDIQGHRVILAAPARTNELVLDRRRRDLGVLVAFATVLGALAALWLSGVAARELARPIGALRGAALAIAGGEREPPLGREPPSEFVPVFTAFRRMAADLDASRRALEEAQRRTAAVLRNVASGVVAASDEPRVLLANPRAEALLGRALAPGDALADVPVLAERMAAFARASDEDEEFDLELNERQLHGRLTRLAAGGVVLTLDDVTALARAQRVLAWGEMARQVAHEIKNPLTPIRLGVQHLRRAHADARPDFDRILQQNVTRILDEIDRLDEIARAFSRYGTAPEERSPTVAVDVAAVARDVVALERMGAGGGVDWRVEGTDDAVEALASRDELKEVLLNVLENSRLAGARTVRTSVAREDGHVRIAIADDGEGIPADALPRIFEPHFSTRTSGSGLGLAISRRLVDGWGGRIGVSSERGRGTVVEVVLRAAN